MENQSIYTRRSIRKYTDEPVPQSVLEEILDAGRVAPSAKNKQPWRFLVYRGQEKKKLLQVMKQGIEREEVNPDLPLSAWGLPSAKVTLKIMENAPIVIMVYNTRGKSLFAPMDVDDRFAEINDMMSIGAAIENMLLKAEELDIGSLWIGNTCFAYRELVEYIGCDGLLVGAVALGHKGENPSMRPRKELEEIVEYFD